jgi:hypothetical protein
MAAFNAAPNSSTAVPVWSDLSSGTSGSFLGASTCKRGRQYELDQNQANAPALTLLDQYEYLNPANTSSPYYPNVLPYRQALWQAMWNPAAGNPTTGNLLNSNQVADSRLGTGTTGYDPTFESYPVGAAVAWLTAVGSTSPVVTTSNPQQGSQDVAWTVASTTTVQGTSWVVPCIPGRQYTCSAYVRQSSASTQSIRVTDQTVAVDAFNRTSASGWGTADVGGAWTTAGGSAGDYSTVAGVAYQSNAAVSTTHVTSVASSVADADVVAAITCPVVATGDEINGGLVTRYADSSNYYMVDVRFNTDQTVGLRIRRRVAGTNTTISSATTSLSYSAGTAVWLRFQTVGPALRCRVWLHGATEPSTWDIDTTDTNVTAAGAVGCRSVLQASNTNTLPVAVAFAEFAAVGSVSGTTTTTTGSYQRLSVTWTATQPTHIVQLATQGTGVAGTVNVDALQHEQAASASTFTTTGPTVYGVWRGYVERWPAAWETGTQGFLGRCDAVGVDAFGPLNRISLSTEYHDSVVAKLPSNYWPLGEPAGAVSFGDQSGNGGPSLAETTSKYGAATFTAGTATNIAGDPSGVGVAILGSTGSGGSDVCNTLQSGYTLTLGGATATYGMSFALWISTTDSSRATVAYMETLANAAPFIFFESGSSPIIVTAAGGTGVLSGSAPIVTDGVPHLLVYTLALAANVMTLTYYVDGTLELTTNLTATTTFGTATPNLAMTSLAVAGHITPYGAYAGAQGTYAHAAVWGRALSAAEVTDLQNAGGGYVAELSGTRVARYLSYGWRGLTDVGAGLSTMGVSTLAAGTKELAACQDVTATENGNFWADRNGVTTFSGREVRYLTLTPQWVFGENTAGGEYPYQENINFGYDPTFLWNTVTINNADGVTVTVANSASVTTYFEGDNPPLAVNTTDNEAVANAQWLLVTHKDPRQRVAQVTLNPAAYPTLWPVVLGIEVNDRVTVKRRPKAANAGAGITMSQDYFVEAVSHDQVDMAGVWTTSLLLSPVPGVQPGILDDSTLGLLDSTMILAF